MAHDVIIERLDIAAFGGISGKSFELDKGVNLINAENEKGKTTLTAAIMFALYGFYSQSHSISENPKRKYMPWSGAAASVSLTLGGSRRLRIERSVSGSKETALCTELNTGLPLYAGKVFGEEILGISAKTAEKLLFFSTVAPHESKDETLAASLQNLLFSADEQVSGEKAIKALTAHKNALKKTVGELETEEARLYTELEKAKNGTEEYSVLEAEIKRLEDALSARETEMEKAEAQRANLQRYQAALLLEEYDSLKERADRAASALAAFGKEQLSTDYISHCRKLREKQQEIKAELAELKEKQKELDGDDGNNVLASLADFCKKSKKQSLMFGAMCVLLVIVAVLCFALKQSLVAIAFGVGGLIFAILALAKSMTCVNTAKGAGFVSVDALVTAAKDAPEKAAAKETMTAALRARIAEKEKQYADITEQIKELGAEGDLDEMTRELMYLSKLRTDRENALAALADFESKHSVSELSELAVGGVKPEKSPTQIETEYKFAAQSAKLLREKLAPKCARLEALRMANVDSAALETEYLSKKRELEEARLSLAAILMAIEELTEAGMEMKSSISPRVSEKASRYFAAATGGKYRGVELDTRLYMSFGGDEGVKSAEHLSAGTRDLAYLCLRLGLLELVYGGSKIPLILDDAFCRQDGKRLSALIDALLERKDQLVITSCTDREQKALESKGVTYRSIRL